MVCLSEKEFEYIGLHKTSQYQRNRENIVETRFPQSISKWLRDSNQVGRLVRKEKDYSVVVTHHMSKKGEYIHQFF